MTVTVTRGTALARVTYRFHLDTPLYGGDGDALKLNHYAEQTRATTRHKWLSARVWGDILANRRTWGPTPVVPDDVVAEARALLSARVLAAPFRQPT